MPTYNSKSNPFAQNRLITLGLLAIAGGILYLITKDFLILLSMSAIITTLTYPIFQRISGGLQKLSDRIPVRNGKIVTIFRSGIRSAAVTFASLATIILTLTSVVLITSLVIGIFINDISKININIESSVDTLAQSKELRSTLTRAGFGEGQVDKFINDSAQALKSQLDNPSIDLNQITTQDFAQRAFNIVTQFGNYILGETVNFLVNFVIFILAWHFMLVDGKNWLKAMYAVSPFTVDEQNTLNNDLKVAINNVILANVLSGLLNAVAVLLICTRFDLPYAILMAVFAFIVGFLPLSPSELAYAIPITLVYLKNPPQAIVLIIVAELYILVLNYVVLPKIIAGSSGNPLLILLSVLAAINLFGLIGFILGPIMVYLMGSLYKIIKQREQAMMAVESIPISNEL